MEAVQSPIELACGLEDCEIMDALFASATAKGTLAALGSGYVFLPFEAIATADISGGDNPKTVAAYAKCKRVLVVKAASVTFTAFAPVYYDVSEDEATSTATDNILIGYTRKAIGANDTSVECTFDGYAEAGRLVADRVTVLETP